MKNKKNDNANLENKKGVFFLIGLILSLGLVLLAFEWKSPINNTKTELGKANFVPDEYVYIPPTRNEKKEIIQKTIEVPAIEIVDNNSDINENVDLFGSDPEDNVFIDFNELVFKTTENKNDILDTVFVFAEQMPEFPGGEPSLLNYLANAIKYPVVAQENGIQGRVFVSFIIDEKGNVGDAQVIREVDSSLDNEALRVVRLLPKWKPGKQGGKPVKVRYTVPINFELR